MIGVAGPTAADLAGSLRAAGATAEVVDPAALPGADADYAALVAVGGRALAAVAATAPDCPVLAVDVDRVALSVGADAVPGLADRLTAGDVATRERPLFGVTVGDSHHRALFDVLLVTAEPAQISGYRVESRTETLGDVRADGVVVASPMGSRGYARDAGGPTIVPGTDALAAVPVAPFTVDPHRWVVTPPVTVTVSREEGTVLVRIDGRDRGTVAPGVPVTVARDGAVALVAAGTEMEKT